MQGEAIALLPSQATSHDLSPPPPSHLSPIISPAQPPLASASQTPLTQKDGRKRALMQTSGKWIIGSAASDLSLLALPRIPDTQRCLFSCSWLSSISSLARSLLVFLSRFLSPLISVFLSPSSHSSSPSSVFLTSFDLFLYLSVLCICLVDFSRSTRCC